MTDPDPRIRPHTARAVLYSLDEIKKIDKSHSSAIDQYTGGFNPLTAGADKSEAQRLLRGKKNIRDEDVAPFYQGAPFLVVCLVLIVAIIAFAAWPPSNRKLMGHATVLMESGDVADWLLARRDLRKILDRKGDGELTQQAEFLYYESFRRTMMARAESGAVGYEPRETREFIEAYNKERDGKINEASEAYRRLIARIEPDSKFRYVRWEAESRLNAIDKRAEQPPTVDGEVPPDNKKPKIGTSETGAPDDEKPDNEKPDNEKPDNEKPDNEKPDNEKPDNEKSGEGI